MAGGEEQVRGVLTKAPLHSVKEGEFRMTREREPQQTLPEVTLKEFHGFEPMVRRFIKLSGPMVTAAKRRRFFRAAPTRSARRRRGKILEVRKRERRQREREERRR